MFAPESSRQERAIPSTVMRLCPLRCGAPWKWLPCQLVALPPVAAFLVRHSRERSGLEAFNVRPHGDKDCAGVVRDQAPSARHPGSRRSPKAGRFRGRRRNMRGPPAAQRGADCRTQHGEDLGEIADQAFACVMHPPELLLSAFGESRPLCRQPYSGLRDSHALRTTQPDEVGLEPGECGDDVEERVVTQVPIIGSNGR